MLKTLLSFFRQKPPVDYAQARQLAQSENVRDRLHLARAPQTHPEILYYLAEKDTDARVRRAAAENTALPLQATPILAQDRDVDVRLVLVQKLCALLPHLDIDQQAQLYGFVVQALGTLALDEVLKIRVALASAIKDVAQAPPSVAGQLARDVARDVSEPILQHCLALTDSDILDILKAHPAEWAVRAIAGRAKLSEAVTLAVSEVADMEAGTTLIENNNAAFTPTVFQRIIARARDFPAWHKPLALRPALPADMALALAQIVDETVGALLRARPDFDADTVAEITAITRRRLDLTDAVEKTQSAAEKLAALLAQGPVGDAALCDAIGIRERDLAILILAHLAETDAAMVQRILDMRAPKPIIALCWKAQLSMRTALVVQKDLAGLAGKDVLLPRGGTDYPLSRDELRWQIDFLNL